MGIVTHIPHLSADDAVAIPSVSPDQMVEVDRLMIEDYGIALPRASPLWAGRADPLH